MGMSLGINRGMALNNTGGSSFSPASLFAASEVGAWYDPSDLSTLFQDTAGTTPVTAAGQSVARINDKSGRGNHASQSTAAGRPTYQTSGGLHWLAFDGSDDFLVTGTITPGVDKAQVFAGVRKLSDATTGTILENSFSPGTLSLAHSDSGTAGYFFASRGSTERSINRITFTAPISSVLTAEGDISGDLARLGVNGVAGQNTGDQGTGNYSALPLYIGRRGGTTLPFNGNIYGLIVRFSSANLDAARISSTERWIAGKTGVTLP